MIFGPYGDVLSIASVVVLSMNKDFLHGLEHIVELLQVAVFGLPDVT